MRCVCNLCGNCATHTYTYTLTVLYCLNLLRIILGTLVGRSVQWSWIENRNVWKTMRSATLESGWGQRSSGGKLLPKQLRNELLCGFKLSHANTQWLYVYVRTMVCTPMWRYPVLEGVNTSSYEGSCINDRKFACPTGRASDDYWSVIFAQYLMAQCKYLMLNDSWLISW